MTGFNQSGVSLTMSGLEGFYEDLMRVESKEAPKIAKAGLRKAAYIIRKAARKIVHVKTGLLRKAISVYQTKGQRKQYYSYSVSSGGFHAAKKRQSRNRSNTSMYGGDAYYGGFVEFGTRRARAFPFLGPAFDQNTNEAIWGLQLEMLDKTIKAMKKQGKA